MKTWIRKTLTGVLGASLALGLLAGCSSRPHGYGSMSSERMAEMRSKMVDRISSKLDLDGTQRQKLQALADRIEAQRVAMGADKPGDGRAQMQALVAGERFDRAGAQQWLDAKTRAVQAGSPEVIAALGDFYDSLRPEQQQKVREWMQQRRGWMHRG